MRFNDIVQQRYATKKFTSENIPQEKIDELLELIWLAPSSLGLQPFKVIIISNQKTKELLKPASFNQEQITTCSHLLVFCTYTNTKERIAHYTKELKKANVPKEKIEGFMALVDRFATRMNLEDIQKWATEQTFLALGNALNGATALGFDSCPVGGFDPIEYAKILKLPEDTKPVVLCPVGYAADKPRKKIRLPKEEIFKKK